MSDIRFYDLDFNLLKILPPFSVDSGYISVNVQQDMNYSGSFECVFLDDELKTIIETYKDNLMVVWKEFQGFVTSYRWDSKLRITGMHLNGLLHRAVVPNTVTELTGDVETITNSAIEKNIVWLSPGQPKGFVNEVKYTTEKYLTADEYIQNLLKLDNAGYKITADFRAKQFVFETIKTNENSLILSEGNLNAYDFEETYINKNLAYGGWYQHEENGWTYITLNGSKEKIHKIDCVLSSKTENEALNELKQKKSNYEILTKTKNIIYNSDYKIGDIIRVQKNGITMKKLVSGINMWQETSYGEQPILTEVE